MGDSYRMGYLSEIVDFRNGKAVSASGGDVPVYGGNGVLGFFKATNYSGCVVIGRVGAYCGSTHIANSDCWVSDNALAGVPKGGACNEYNYYLLKALKLNEWRIGSSQPLLTQGILNSIQVRIEFDNRKQKKIAAVLSALDAKIDLNNRINAELEALAKTIYDYWFVQFDFPDANGRPYKTSGGAMVWNDTLKREIPEGWEVGSLWSIATYTNGLAMQRFRPEGEAFLPVIKIKEMSDGYGAGTERASPSIGSKYIVADGDVLFSWSATLAVQIWTLGRGALNQHIFKVTSKAYPKIFYYFELLNYLNHFKMMAEKRKTTMGHITLDHLKQSAVVIPPIPLIKQLDALLQPLFEQSLGLNKQIQELTQLRDWLLPLLMNGQVRVT